MRFYGGMSRPLRIACVLHAADVTGPAKTLAPRLRLLAADAEVIVVVPGAGSAGGLFEPFAEVRQARYRVLTRSAALPRLLLDVVRFMLLFSRLRVDLVIVGSSLLPAALVAARVLGKRVVVYSGELLHPGSDRADRLVARLTDKLASEVVACSDTAARAYRSPVVIRPGIPPPTPHERDAARRALGVPLDSFCVAAVGSLTRGRGQDVLLRALGLLEKPAVGVVAGEPHPREVDRVYAGELRDLASELGVDVRFLGFVEDVGAVYAAADVFVNPARFDEPFGRAALEALAAGTPVVATTAGAIPEVLTDGVDALLVAPDDPAALAAAVDRLRNGPQLGRALVTGAAPVLARSDEAENAARFRDLVLAGTVRST
jgi:glycosyltransferase involved in cell wall biosynthesis